MESRKAHSFGQDILDDETPVNVIGKKFEASIEHLETMQL